jgi:hypothetical protein
MEKSRKRHFFIPIILLRTVPVPYPPTGTYIAKIGQSNVGSPIPLIFRLTDFFVLFLARYYRIIGTSIGKPTRLETSLNCFDFCAPPNTRNFSVVFLLNIL